MTDLLQVVKIPKKEGSSPLFVEFTVNEQLIPFLVTSTRDFLWVSKLRNSKVKAAVRKGLDTPSLYLGLVQAVLKQSQDSSWGSIFKHSPDGLSKALIRMKEYGFEDCHILTSSNVFSSNPFLIHCDWLPAGLSIVVPKDRDFLGTLGVFEGADGAFCALVHNAGRGMCILNG